MREYTLANVVEWLNVSTIAEHTAGEYIVGLCNAGVE